MMWPFKKKKNPNIEMMSPDELRYSQLDITEAFGDTHDLRRTNGLPPYP